MNLRSSCAIAAVTAAVSALPARAAFEPVISEFLASSENSIRDEDGDRPDWIEIYNDGNEAGNLDGWCLTDFAGDLAKWAFPDTPLAVGSYRVVFASGKSRRVSGRELHTNFKLGTDGEYLALVKPDRATVASEFAPAYPVQLADISYGIAMASSQAVFLATNAVTQINIPSDNGLGLTWTQGAFTPDASWTNGTTGIGFDMGSTPVSNLVAHWTLDEPLGEATIGDVSGNGHGGLASAGVTLGSAGATNTTGTAASYNNGSIDVPYDPDLNPASFTVTAWARPVTGGSGHRSVITSRRDSSGKDGYIIYLDPSDIWQFWTGDGAGGWRPVNGPAAVLDTWTHLAISFDSATQTKTFYINGAAWDSVTDQGYSPNPSRDLHVGGGGDAGTQYRFRGDIDDVAVFSAALDVNAIRAAMSNSIPESGTEDYGGHIRTDLAAAMYDVNSSVYLRMPFTVADTPGFAGLLLRMKYDDGFLAYLNGDLIASRNAPALPDYNSVATTRNPDAGAVLFEELNVSSYLGSLRNGANILAIHGLNVTAANEDVLVVPELVGITAPTLRVGQVGYFAVPTPGGDNAASATVLGPLVTDVGHLPPAPTASQDLVVTASISQTFHPVDSVTLHHRTMYGAVSTLAMADDGAGGDAAAGDGVYSATIPAGTAALGEMLRYYITAVDTAANTMREPLFTDQEGTKQSPEYYGTRVRDPSITSALPVFYWWTQNYAASHTRSGVRASVFFKGEFYDNVFVRMRGQATNANSQKFVFGKSHRFHVNETLGRVREINMNAQGSDASYIRQTLAFQFYGESGMPSCESFLVLMRVNGGSDRVGVFIEQVDEDFLERYDLDEFGSLYKFVQKRNLNPCLSEQPDGVERKIPEFDADFSDLQALIDGLALATDSDRRAYVFDNFNVPEMISYLVARAVIQDCDDVRKNFYMHRDTYGSGEWRIFPWDKDWGFGILGDGGTYATHPFLGDYVHRKQNANQWSRLLEVFYNLPETRDMFRRRTRTVMDAYLLPPGTPAGQSWLEQKATALFAPADPHLGSGATSSYNGVLNYVPGKRTNLYVTHHASNLPADVAGIPDAQSQNAAIHFGAYEISPPSGDQDEEYLQLVNTNAASVDISGWTIKGGVNVTFVPGTVILASNVVYVSPRVSAFRSRAATPKGGQGLFVVGDYSGHLSTLGETLTLRASDDRVVDTLSFTGLASAAQQALRITEVMYHPRLPDTGTVYPERDYEFVELRNTGPVALDLTGVHFSEGMDFTFGAVALDPGEHVVIARTPSVFATRHDTNGLHVVGPYDGFLDNGGEKIVLKDALEQTIASMAYGDGRGWPLAADGAGHALVPRIDGGIQGTLLHHAGNWRAGTYRDGSPGVDDPAPFNTLLLNEIAAHTDYSDPSHPEYESNDWLELFNTTASPAALVDWYLSDDAGDLKKWAIPATNTIVADGWGDFDEIRGFHNPTNTGFGLNKAGEQIFLSHLPGTAQDRVADAVRFKGQENGTTLGRYADGAANWHATVPTRGEANALSGSDVVISEIMYHPAPTVANPENNTNDEYIEIYNQRETAVSLWTVAGSWRVDGEVTYVFPSNTTLSAKARVTLTSFDPLTNAVSRDAFLAAYGLTNGQVALLGPYAGQLDNEGGRVAVERPQAPDPPGEDVSWVIVDEVHYFDSIPWPSGTDGTGVPLRRYSVNGSGNDPASWGVPLYDRDGDGLPDAWEEAYLGGTNAVPEGHGDADEMTNGDEYYAGTDPADSPSVFRLEIAQSNGIPSVQFMAREAAGPGYDGLIRYFELQYSADLPGALWRPVAGFTNILGRDQTVRYGGPTNRVLNYRARAWMDGAEE